MHLVTVTAIVVLFCSPATGADERARAKEHFQKGAAAFQAKDYETAIAEYRRSLEALENAPTLYALGLAAEAAHRDEIAIEAYNRYLSLAASGPRERRDHAAAFVRDFEQRAQKQREEREIAERAQRLREEHEAAERAKVAQANAQQTAARTPDEVGAREGSARRRSWTKNPAGWVLLSGSVAIAAIGLGLALHGGSRIDEARNARTLPDQRQAQQDANTFNAAGLALIGTGAALAVASIIVFTVPPKRSSVTAGVYLDGRSLGLVAGGVW